MSVEPAGEPDLHSDSPGQVTDSGESFAMEGEGEAVAMSTEALAALTPKGPETDNLVHSKKSHQS